MTLNTHNYLQNNNFSALHLFSFTQKHHTVIIFQHSQYCSQNYQDFFQIFHVIHGFSSFSGHFWTFPIKTARPRAFRILCSSRVRKGSLQENQFLDFFHFVYTFPFCCWVFRDFQAIPNFEFEGISMILQVTQLKKESKTNQ